MKLLKDYSKKELSDHQKGQKIMTNMLKEFDNICRTNGLKYWCVGGTLIGAVRHKGWIPHDADIDVAMLKSDYEQLQNIIQKKLSKDYWFQDKSTDKYYKSEISKIRYLYAQYDDYKCQSWHNGIQLDIFVFHEEDHLLNPHMELLPDIKIINKDIIFPLKTLVFENIQVYVPNNYKKFLIDFFDGYPPPILPSNQQYPHEGRISFNIPEWMIRKYPELYKNKKLTLFSDGIFDLFHHGHLNYLKKIKEYFNIEVYLIIGIINDELSTSYKRQPIFSEIQRKKILESCIYVNKVIIMNDLILTEDFIKVNDIDYVFHAFSNKEDSDKQLIFYETLKKLNKFIEIDYSHGISTTQIIKDTNLNWDDIWMKKGNENKTDLYLLNGWENTNFNPKECVNNIIDKLSINNDNTIIEIGCGAGLLSQYFNKQNYMGIDKSLSLINKNIELLKSNVINFSSTEIIFKDNSFDYCICHSMLEYLKDYNELDKTINNIERITKKGIYIGSIRHKTRIIKEDKHMYNGIHTHFIIPKKYFKDRNYIIIDNKYCNERYDAYKLI